ncbi:hypothetical protein D9M73_193540 [compost metagenome]
MQGFTGQGQAGLGQVRHRLAIAEDIGQASAGFLLQHGQPDGECVVQCLRVPAFDLGAL